VAIFGLTAEFSSPNAGIYYHLEALKGFMTNLGKIFCFYAL
jgi:hypothetical protein